MTNFPNRLFTHSELDNLGVSRQQLTDGVRQRLVRQVMLGVYISSATPDSPKLRAAAAALVLPDHVVVSDRTAAWLHGIDCFDPTALDLPPDLEVVSTRASRTRRSGVLGGKRQLAPEDICVVDGIRVTTPVRTACDLACQRGRSTGLAVLDAFRRKFGLTSDDFDPLVRRFVGRRGVVQLRELLHYADPRSESAGESWTRMAIIDAGLPTPTLQYEVVAGERYRLDLAYPRLKIAVEYDGEEFHSSDSQRDADLRRRQVLRDAGWIVIVVRKDDFTGPALDRWLGELTEAISVRRPPRGRSYPKPSRETRLVHPSR